MKIGRSIWGNMGWAEQPTAVPCEGKFMHTQTRADHTGYEAPGDRGLARNPKTKVYLRAPGVPSQGHGSTGARGAPVTWACMLFQRNAYVLRETFSSAKSCFARFVACGPRSLKTLPIAYAEAKIQKRRGDGLTQGARSPRLNLDRLRQSRQRCRRVTGRGAKRLRTGGTGGRATSALESDATTVRPMELAGWSLKGSGGLISNVRVGFAPRLGRAPLEGCGGLCSKVRAGFIRRFERAFLEGSGGPHSEVRAGFTQRFGRAPLESGGGLYCNVRAGFTRRFARALLASSELKPKVQALSRRFRI